MGKGGMSQGGSGEDGVEENMAAWLLGVNTLKIQPFHLPPLGMYLFLFMFYSPSVTPSLLTMSAPDDARFLLRNLLHLLHFLLS